MDNIVTKFNISDKQPQKVTVADKALNLAAKIWFITAVIGQWIFAYYVIAFYVSSAVQGNFDAWIQVIPKAIIKGDTMGNVAVIGHLFLAVIIIVLGPLQFVPQIRNRFPSFHRWNGRIYLVTVFITSVFGLYMVWVRGSAGGMIQHIGISLDGILIMIFSILTVRFALVRKFNIHLRWALRLFMAVSAVWFFRVGLMFWILINNGPAGFDPETFQGPFLNFWSFGQYLVPLVFLEFYFLARDRGNELSRFIMATCLIILTIAMSAGIFIATMSLWLPRL